MTTNETQREQVLIVEDQSDLRRLYRAALECLDVDLFEAPDGAAAAEMLAELCPHVVITDLQMPRMDGFELCRLVMRNGGIRRPEVIAITGQASSENIARIHAYGARTCLSKPFPMSRLVCEVEDALTAHQGA
jgi:two-component system chemotaxis response regulator CheY